MIFMYIKLQDYLVSCVIVEKADWIQNCLKCRTNLMFFLNIMKKKKQLKITERSKYLRIFLKA